VPDRNALQFANELARMAHHNRSEDIVVLDLRGISGVTDFVVICTGTSERQMRGVAERILEYARKLGERPFGVSGLEGGVWILLDFVDVVFHIFTPSSRAYYDLELLWGDAPRLEWARAETA
jgi:ribosome-associated protein